MNLAPEALCQIEIQVTDMDRSKRFYEHVFGWKVAPAEMYNYVVLQVSPECPWGISLVPAMTSAKNQAQIILYFQVDDAESVASLAELHGGAKKFGPAKLPAYGNIWQISDPDGHRFGLFENKTHSRKN